MTKWALRSMGTPKVPRNRLLKQTRYDNDGFLVVIRIHKKKNTEWWVLGYQQQIKYQKTTRFIHHPATLGAGIDHSRIAHWAGINAPSPHVLKEKDGTVDICSTATGVQHRSHQDHIWTPGICSGGWPSYTEWCRMLQVCPGMCRCCAPFACQESGWVITNDIPTMGTMGDDSKRTTGCTVAEILIRKWLVHWYLRDTTVAAAGRSTAAGLWSIARSRPRSSLAPGSWSAPCGWSCRDFPGHQWTWRKMEENGGKWVGIQEWAEIG